MSKSRFTAGRFVRSKGLPAGFALCGGGGVTPPLRASIEFDELADRAARLEVAIEAETNDLREAALNTEYRDVRRQLDAMGDRTRHVDIVVFCACGRIEPECDGSRAGCHSHPWCRLHTHSVNDEVCERCRRRHGVDAAGEPIKYGAGLANPADPDTLPSERIVPHEDHQFEHHGPKVPTPPEQFVNVLAISILERMAETHAKLAEDCRKLAATLTADDPNEVA